MNSLKPFSIPCLLPKEELQILRKKATEKNGEPASDYSKPSKKISKLSCSSSSTESSFTSHVLSHSSDKPVQKKSSSPATVASAPDSFSSATTSDDIRTVRTSTPAQCNTLEPSPSLKIKLKRTLKEDGTYNYRIDASHPAVKPPTPSAPHPPPCPTSVSYSSLSHETINDSSQTVTRSRQQFEHSPLVSRLSHSLTEIENKQLSIGDRLSRKRTSSSIERPVNFKHFNVSMPRMNNDYFHSTPLNNIRNRPAGQTTPIISRPLNLYNGGFMPIMSHLLNQRNEAATPITSRPLNSHDKAATPITSSPLNSHHESSPMAKRCSVMKNDRADVTISIYRPPPPDIKEYFWPTLNRKEDTEADAVSLRSKESNVYSYTNGYNICHRSLSSISTSNGRTTITNTSETMSTRTSTITNKPSCLAEEGIVSTVTDGGSIEAFTSHHRDADLSKHHDITKLSKPVATTRKEETSNDSGPSNSIPKSSKGTERVLKETNCETKPLIEGVPLESNHDHVVPKLTKLPSQEVPMETTHVPKLSKQLFLTTEGVLKETRRDRKPSDDSVPKLSQLCTEEVPLETNYEHKHKNGIPTSSQPLIARPKVPPLDAEHHINCKPSSIPTLFQPPPTRPRVPLETNHEPSSIPTSSQPLPARPRVPQETNHEPSSIPTSSQPLITRPRVPPLEAKHHTNRKLRSNPTSFQPPPTRPRVPLMTNHEPSCIPTSSQPLITRPRVPPPEAKHHTNCKPRSNPTSFQPPPTRPRVPLGTNHEPSCIPTSSQPLPARPRVPLETNCEPSSIPTSFQPPPTRPRVPPLEAKHHTNRKPRSNPTSFQPPPTRPRVPLGTNHEPSCIPTSSQPPPTRPRVPLETNREPSSIPTSFQPPPTRPRVPLGTNHEPSCISTSSQPLPARPRVPLETNREPSCIPTSFQPPPTRPRVPLGTNREPSSIPTSSQPLPAKPGIPLQSNHEPSSIPTSSQPPTAKPGIPLQSNHEPSSIPTSSQPPTAKPGIPLQSNHEPSSIPTSSQPPTVKPGIPLQSNHEPSSIPTSSQPSTAKPGIPLQSNHEPSSIPTSSQPPTVKPGIPLQSNHEPSSIPTSSQPPTAKPGIPLQSNHEPSSIATSSQPPTAKPGIPLQSNHEPSSIPTSPKLPRTTEGVLKEISHGCEPNSIPKSSNPPSEGVLPVASTAEQSKPNNSSTEVDDDDSVIVINIDSPLSIIDSLNSSSTSEPAPPQSNPPPPQTLQELSSNPSYMADINSPDSIESNSSQQLSDKKYQAILRDWQDKLNQKKKESDALIFVENNVDKALPPFGFNYISESIHSKSVPRSDPMALVGCSCTSCNDSSMCCPRMAGHRFAYYKNGKLKVAMRIPIYECNRMCHCDSNCNNRVVQKGSQYPLCIFRTSNGCGWGVKTCCPIEKGKFIAEYVGELITFEEAEKRGKQYDREGSTYLFDLDFNDSAEFTIDATHNGNVSHFFNHSCDPNLVVFSVWVDTLDLRLPRLGLFALKDIGKGEELTFDYQMNHNMTSVDADKRIPCLCGSKKCRKFLF